MLQHWVWTPRATSPDGTAECRPGCNPCGKRLGTGSDLISCVGLENPAGAPRWTFGSAELTGGISLIPLMIGMFAISEVLRFAVRVEKPVMAIEPPFGNVFSGMWALLKKYPLQLLRGSALGTAVGALPGAGADIAAWMSYAMSKKFSKEPEKFGTGHVEGIVESGAANNAAPGGAWIPALVFGIPGDSITAIIIGVLYMKNMNPGPSLFMQNPQNVYAVYLLFIIANLIMSYAVEKATSELNRWQSYFPLREPLFCSVNVSARQLFRHAFFDDVASILREEKPARLSLKLELTESVIMQNPESTARALAKLQRSQLPSGAFPWFPAGPPSPYMTLYILCGFGKALEFGVEVPRPVVERAWASMHQHYVDELVDLMMGHDCCWETITFLNYVLSSYPDESWTGGVFTADDRQRMLDFSFRHWKQHQPLLKGYLALTLERAGRHDDATLVFDSVMDSAKTDQDLGTYWAPEDRAWLWWDGHEIMQFDRCGVGGNGVAGPKGKGLD